MIESLRVDSQSQDPINWLVAGWYHFNPSAGVKDGPVAALSVQRGAENLPSSAMVDCCRFEKARSWHGQPIVTVW